MRRLLLLVGLLAAAGCDRVPIDPPGTTVLVTEPDLSVVFLEPDLRLRLAPDGPRGPLTVTIRSKEVDFDSTEGVFVYERALARGLNEFPLEVTDADGEVQRDTLYALYLPIARVPLLRTDDSVARAGAAAASLGFEGVAVTGGADASGAALPTASVVEVVNAQLASREVPLVAARAGHSATAVAGGVLLLGGTARSAPTDGADFVTVAEWIGPDGTSRAVEVTGVGEAPARAGHVARAVETGGETYVYLLGGRVPAAGGTAVSDAVEVYRVLPPLGPDAALGLERISPDGGAAGFAALADATLAPTGAARAAVFGMTGGEGAALSLAWALPGTTTFPFSLRVAAAGGLRTPRTAAAAVDLGDGLALVTGGRGPDGAPVRTLEVYAAAADRSFRFPESVGLAVPRSEHVATILSGGRILLIGGRPASGGPIVAAEAFRL